MSTPSGKALKVVIKGWATEPLCKRSFGSIALRWKIWLLQSWAKLHPGISWNQSPRKGMSSLSLSLNLVNSPTHSVGQSPKWLQMMMIYPYVELKILRMLWVSKCCWSIKNCKWEFFLLCIVWFNFVVEAYHPTPCSEKLFARQLTCGKLGRPSSHCSGVLVCGLTCRFSKSHKYCKRRKLQ